MIQLNPNKTSLQFEQENGIEDWKKTLSEHDRLDADTGAFFPLRNIQKMLSQNDTSAVNYRNSAKTRLSFDKRKLH